MWGRSSFPQLVLVGLLLGPSVLGYRVPVSDTDEFRETCSGMFGGKEAYIEVAFDPASSGQVALVIYEWSDVGYLGVDTPDDSVGGTVTVRPKTYICTTSAIRTGLCTTSQLGSFITSLPQETPLNSTSIFTTALKFSSSSFPSPSSGDDIGLTPSPTDSDSDPVPTSDGDGGFDDDGFGDGTTPLEELEEDLGGDARERQLGGIADGIAAGIVAGGEAVNQDDAGGDGVAVGGTTTYSSPLIYAVPKTGYYCIGIVPVTLVGQRDTLSARQATHAEYSGMVLFRNTFEGELPAAEYPKINFYLALTVVYFALGCGWAFLCVKHFSELLPMQYYMSGTIVFLIIEMVAQFAYYRYINKHGGGATSIAFLFVIAVLNAARNSLSFFLLLIVSMGLSVVTQSLGPVMTRVRVLTAFHFIFGVLYSVGTVQVELDNAALAIVLVLIFPLALTLTAFLMWIIISLNGTILHLQQKKQRYKLQMFKRLWRILILAVIAVAAFFVVSSMSLSNRLDEDYAPRNWKYRWILLDGSLATIYLLAFSAIAWLWRPTRDNVRFSTSQELAQDENEADAEDYEIGELENGRHRPLAQEDDEDEDNHNGSGRGVVREENVVFAMGDDSDDDDDDEGSRGAKRASGEYRDADDGKRRSEDNEERTRLDPRKDD